MPPAGTSRFDWRRMPLARRAAATRGPRPPGNRGNGLVIGAVIVGVSVILLWWLFSGNGDDNGKKKDADKPKTNPTATSSASRPATATPKSTARLTAITRQAIGLEIREKPGQGKVIAELAEGTGLTATCTAKGRSVYGWRGGKSDQWVLVTTPKGQGYAPEAWLETTGSAKEVLPTC